MRTYVPISAAVLLAASALTVTGSVPVATAAAMTTATTTVTAPCSGSAAGAAPAAWDHVTLIMFENKPLKKIIGNTADAPYINSIAKACSYSKNDLSLSTTSLANYVALTSGYTGCDKADTNGICTHELPITANKPPSSWPQASKSIFELMNTAAPGSAVEWAEDSQGELLHRWGRPVHGHAHALPVLHADAERPCVCSTPSRSPRTAPTCCPRSSTS